MTGGRPGVPDLMPGGFFAGAGEMLRVGLAEVDDDVFDVLRWLGERLEKILAQRLAGAAGSLPPAIAAYRLPFGDHWERAIHVREPFWTGDTPLAVPEAGVWIAARVRLEPTVIVKGPAIVETGCDLRQGAYLRGSTYIGPHCVVGHTTEVKNAIFLEHAEAGHFAYVGDSILGASCNLGAGTKLANLQFRTEEEKATGRIRSVVLRLGAEARDTGLVKLGAVLGDAVEIGCNTVTSPGTLLGPGTWVLPNLTVPKGYYPARSLLVASGAGLEVRERP